MIEEIVSKALQHTTFARRGAASAIEHEVAPTAVRKIAKPAMRDAIDRTLKPTVEDLQKSRAELAVMKAPTLRNKITYHLDPDASQAALLESIKTSKSSYYIETFIWHNDAAGNEVIDALKSRIAEAKAKGEYYDAKVMIDWFGLRQGTGGTGDPQIVQKLRDAGVQVIEFSPGYVTDGKLIPITHRKLYIKDGSSFITGGRNIGDEYLKDQFKDPAGAEQTSWHDLLYTVEGDETGRILDQFFKNWQHAGGEMPAVRPTIVPSADGRARVQSFITNPITRNTELQKAQLGLIANAESEIVIMYPYFSDDKLVAALREAKRKNPNLSIKVMLPASREVTAEGGVYTLLNRESARQMMADGIEIRMFSGGSVKGKTVERFSHFKAMMVDGKVVSIGSANGDARTFHNNHELITTIADPGAARDFRAQVVDPDWASATPLTHADLAKDSLLTRIKQRVLEWLDFLL